MRTARRVRVRVRYTSRILLGPRRMRSPPTGQALPANGDAQACRRRRWRTITARAWPGRSSGPFALTLNGECACSVAAIGLRAVRPPWFARSGRRGWTPCARPLWSSAGAARKAARSGRLRQASFCVCSSRPRGSFHCDRTSRCHRRGSLAHSTGLMTVSCAIPGEISATQYANPCPLDVAGLRKPHRCRKEVTFIVAVR